MFLRFWKFTCEEVTAGVCIINDILLNLAESD